MKNRRTARSGVLALELLFALPLIIGMLLAMIQFSLFLSARQQVANATREGARVLALGGNLDEVRLAVDRFLGPQTADVSATVTDGNGNSILPGQPVEVVVRIPTKFLVPDMLGMIGFGWGDSTLIAKSVMRKE
jgi:Flp pilus assembly protein TadG